ncbi:DUF4360 domain-containing protein [Kitasatospora sp. NBC_01250]|uniref:DUF4360 domain-containing protein n=1 Tax=unclassified Kitasatospora TaxID=2633591 RepID=UPI002E0FA01F|nr:MULTISPECIES: DUF4360 domain-containing protein [unclassified Kitasatospora]WSJ65451.1 DUF4360 domain-containing protein [Kitasatospora sp. NBC_01302]
MLRALATGGTAATLLAASLLCGTAAHARTVDVTPPGFTIGLVSVNGSGCPAGTAAVATSPDDTAFTVTYSNYLAQAGAGSGPTDFRKNCQLTVQVNAPQGFTYAVAEADYRGYAYLASGASAQEGANYYFQGQPQTATATHSFTGPMDDNWQASDTTTIASLVWAPCGATRDLNINTQLRVSAGSSDPSTTSFVTMDSTDGSLTTIYHLDWEQCVS